jgi:Ca2+-binding EF-hand superfamily protein
MTTIAGGSNLTQQLYQKLFDRLNTDGDDAVSLTEMTSAGASADDTAKVFKAMDADGDGRVMRAEMTPSDAFGVQVMNALISAQSESMTDEAFVADLIARADTDGDGALSRDELEAHKDLQRAAALDAGYLANRAVIADDADGDGLIRADEIRVGRALKLSLENVKFAEDMPAEQLAEFNAVRERMGQPPLAPLTPEERQRRLDQLAADFAERDAAPEGATGFLSRTLGESRAKESARLEGVDLTDALVARLFSQVLKSWDAQAVPGASADLKA